MGAVQVLMGVGCAIAFATIGGLLWSIRHPDRRRWPPQNYHPVRTPMTVWGPTSVLVAILMALAVMNWGRLPLAGWVRYGFGVPLIVVGNIVIVAVVSGFGFHQTGGAVGTLKTTDAYRYSRNPQYAADIAMMVGWMLLSASAALLPVGLLTIAVLILAPFAEEPWMRRTYGADYDAYATKTRRFL